MRVTLIAVFGACGALTATACQANDTNLSYGGSPRALSGHPSVAMRSEVVRIDVGEKLVTVDCRFVFANSGPAQMVRMGFPDENEETTGELNDPKSPPTPSFNSFRSWVNGKQVKIALVKGATAGSVWHVKTVAFPAHAVVEVRDRYTVPVGTSMSDAPIAVNEASYILHTGASWRGNIGRTEVDITFHRTDVGSPIDARPAETGNYATPTTWIPKPWRFSSRTVYYLGPCDPIVNGRTLRFIRTNWRPTMRGDVLLKFNLRK